MRRIVLTFGLIAGGVLSAMMLLTLPFMDRIGFDHGAVIGYTTMVLAFLLVYFGVRSYRDTVADGRIGFWKAVGVGLLIVAVANVCYVTTWQFIYHFITPDFFEKYAAHELAQARAAGATPEQLAAQAREAAHLRDLYRNPFLHIAFTFAEPLPVGVPMTLLCAALLRRRRRAESDALAVGRTVPAV